MTKRIALLLFALLALAAAGCGGGSSNDNSSASSSPNTQPAPAQGGSGGGSASSGEVTVEMKNYAFSPKSVTVKVGQTVKWTNEDNAPHNATGDGIKTDTVNKGGTVTYKATKAGTFNYICTIHPYMKGTVTVTS